MPRKPLPLSALYVRIPTTAVAKLDRAAEALGVPKKALVADLVARYVDPDSRTGLSALGALTQPRPVMAGGDSGAGMVGSYSFRPHELPEIMTAAQAGEFLQLDEATVVKLALAGQLPGRKLGTAWRFARAALISWLSSAEQP
jgi:excisionase family DNA binding protein